MKHYINFLILPLLCGLFVSCEMGSECVGSVPPPYRLRNQSGHVVAFVNRPACRELPDSLVLQPGENFDFDSGLGSYGETLLFFGNSGYQARLVYYDGRYVIKVKDLQVQRRPTESFNFKERIADWYTYTFTDEDYAYAVAHGADLQAE